MGETLPEQEIDKFCLEVRRKGSRLVMLFGSRATGAYTDESDADICLVADWLPEDLFKRRYPAPSGYISISVFGFHPREFLSMIREANPFVLDIVHYGRTLYDDGFLKEVRKAYRQAVKEHGLRRTELGWEWRVDPG